MDTAIISDESITQSALYALTFLKANLRVANRMAVNSAVTNMISFIIDGAKQPIIAKSK